MAQSTRRRKKTIYVNTGASNEFFLFVAFHSAINAVMNFFKDD